MARGPNRDDEEETAVFDSARRPADDASVYDPAKRSAEPRPNKETRRGYDGSGEIAVDGAPEPIAATKSEPIRVISMKTPSAEKIEYVEPKQRGVQLRAIAEFHSSTPPGGMGRLAPPRDEREVRGRRRKDVVMWSFAVLVIGGLVMAILVLLVRHG